MNILEKLFQILSKGFDFSKSFTKDDDTKDILIGISAIFALCVTAVKVFENIQSIKRLTKITKKAR